jgi:hypothetical protein
MGRVSVPAMLRLGTVKWKAEPPAYAHEARHMPDVAALGRRSVPERRRTGRFLSLAPGGHRASWTEFPAAPSYCPR